MNQTRSPIRIPRPWYPLCKNIFYTVVNSGNYTIPDPNAGKMDNMTKMFIGIDAGVAVVALGAMAAVLIRWNRKRKSEIKVVVEK